MAHSAEEVYLLVMTGGYRAADMKIGIPIQKVIPTAIKKVTQKG
jgi:hypothetical protein